MYTSEQWNAYTAALRRPFQKAARLRFLNESGGTMFAVGTRLDTALSGAWISDGTLSVNRQNGTRRTASVTLSNVSGRFAYDCNHLWYGSRIALDEGLILPDGTLFYLPQGEFYIVGANEDLASGANRVQLSLSDKWAGIDGTIFGTLDSTYVVERGTNIFAPIASILLTDRGDGLPFDPIAPVFTTYYNGKAQELPDGTPAALTDSPYTMRIDSENGTVADAVSELAGMVNAWVGYDASGRMRIDPSQDDILDGDKPVSWRFRADETQVLGLAYDNGIQDVVNDYIVTGGALDGEEIPAARAQDNDPKSDVCISSIGRRTRRESKPEYATKQMCRDYAQWQLQREAVLRKAVNVQSSQIFHVEENTIIEIARTDKPGGPVERHLVTGFTRPLVGTNAMTIQAVSVTDFPTIDVQDWGYAV